MSRIKNAYVRRTILLLTFPFIVVIVLVLELMIRALEFVRDERFDELFAAVWKGR